jgi:hypothetical protein
LPQFNFSRAHVLYAAALDYAGNSQEAEKEFISMKGRFSNYEARYQYGLFLIRNNRPEEARLSFTEMIDEASHLSPVEKRYNRAWFAKSKEELRKMKTLS